MKKLLLSLMAVLGVCFMGLAQNKLVQGTVSDGSGSPIIGAAVIVDGTSLGTSTDGAGKFAISAPTNGTLVVSFLGYDAVSVPINNQTFIEVVLKESSETIDDVVVVAYGTASRASLTGSVSQVKAEAIEKRPNSSVTASLEGTTTGIQVNNSYGQPGSDPTILIRGFGTVNGSTSPLYVVDGVPFGGNISDLNPGDIESLSVLKDASSAALFGNRAANGVILITTKQGRKDKLSVNVGIKQGIYQRAIPEYDRLGADDFMEMMWRGAKNYAQNPLGLGYSEADAIQYAHRNTIPSYIKNNIYNKPDTELFTDNGKLVAGAQVLPGYDDLDWFDYVERLGHRQEYTISADVAGDKFSAFMSAGYLGEKGYTMTSDFQRFTGRANLIYKPNKWLRLGMNLSASSQESDFMKSDSGSSYANPFYTARYMAPVYPVFEHDATGAKVLDANGDPIYTNASFTGNRNVVYENIYNKDKYYRQTMQMQPFATITFLKDFQFTIKGDLNVRNTKEHTFDNPFIGDGSGNNGRLGEIYYRYKNYTFQQQLTWGHSYGQHNVDALLAHESYKNAYGYNENHKANQMLYGSNTVPDNFSELTSIDGANYAYATESYLGRVRYNYDEKYFVEGSFRRDGSSRFHPDHRWGNFWSAGASWMISREEFMENATWVNDLKLRAAYGQVGNDAGVGYYGYMSLYSSDNNGGLGAYYKSQNEANDIKWETTATLDIALEGRLWNRVNFSFDYFDKRSKDLLFDVYLPNSAGATNTSSGTSTITKNIGSISNRGLEIEIDVDVIRRRDWRWNIGANATFLKNKVIELPNHEDIPNGRFLITEGRSMYDIYYYIFEGVDQMTGNSLYRIDPDYAPGGSKASADSQKWDVLINGTTYTRNTTYAKKDWFGTGLPKVYGGINTSLTWKNLTFSAVFTYSIGGKLYDSNYGSLMSVSGGASANAMHKDLLKSWNGVPAGMTETSADRIDPNGIPVIDYSVSSYNNAASTRWLISNSYFTIKNLSLAYEFPRTVAQKIGLQGLSISANVENAAIFAARKGANPQYNFYGGSGNTFVTARVYSLGLNIKL